MKVLLIDNYDSFTWNLHHLLVDAGIRDIQVVFNDRIDESVIIKADALVFSPGPGLPDAAGQMKRIIKQYAETKKILGICLGHQAIAEVFGARIVPADEIFHGTSADLVLLENDYIFKNMPAVVQVGRYHSWVVSPFNIPPDLVITATDNKGVVMAIRHKVMNINGLQFHPESIMTPLGVKMIKNWMKL